MLLLLENHSGGAGPVSYTLTADPGVFVESGTNAALLAARKISAAVGAFSESGTAVAFRATRVLSATQGTFSCLGIDATLFTGVPPVDTEALDFQVVQLVSLSPLSEIILYKQNDQFLQATITDATTGLPINDANSVIANMKDLTGGAISEITNLTLSLVDNGIYRALVLNTFNPMEGAGYYVLLDITTASGQKAHIEVPCEVQIRHN